MSIHFPILFVTALVPMFVGFFWYHEKTFGKPWQVHSRTTDDMIKGGNMALIMGLSYFFNLMLSLILFSFVIHQWQVQSLFASDPDFGQAGAASTAFLNDFFEAYGEKHRTFKHGVVHGVFIAVFFVLPVIAVISLFERRNWKYILIQFGYWLICLSIMGGILCQFG